ncbi:cytochrome c, class I [Luminiphilus syltensis NOR5-1B]|uniref:Cytochrome c, class I n=1 Tax=Luminiphilus syltensis NOR5-1B TaxID=565045 RepID=B8KUJ7_9GAMM|nr:c-type cytochrome [Luminiphilus syltensis]EED34709.1 cytochrome c, class I [Luminiphilus syltensis NOR5-1B]
MFQRIVGRCFAAISLSFALVTVASAATGVKGDPESGSKMVATCAACHGADGNSAVPNFPKLAGLGEKYLLKQMKDIRSGLRPVAAMAGQVDNLSDQQLADIAAFYDSQERTREMADPDLVDLGRSIYMAGIADRKVAACSGCHSPTGKGNGPGGFPGLAGQHADYLAAQLKMFRKGYEDDSGRVNDGDSKIMRTTAFELSDLEIEAVASYASGLQ